MAHKRKSSNARKRVNRSKKYRGGAKNDNINTSESIENDDVDVVTEEDIDKMLAVLKKYLIVLGSVQADWCGHCKTFKPVWDKYKKTTERKIPMINVNEKMLSKTPFAKAKIDGFPSTVLYSPKDKSFASFNKEDGEETHSMPNSRDENAMSTLLKTDPSKLKLSMNNNNSRNGKSKNANANANNSGKDSESPTIRSEMEESLNASAKDAIKNKNTPALDMEPPFPPNTKDDVMNEAPSAKVPVKSPIFSNKGGALYQRMLRIVNNKGPATRRHGKGMRRTAKHLKY